MATVDRVLPWRRTPAPNDQVLAPLIADYRVKHPKGPTGLIVKAYETAKAAHAGQTRRSGEAYITHPLAVATILAELGMTESTLSAALLHDTTLPTGRFGCAEFAGAPSTTGLREGAP